ncbi:MAG: Oligopeptidase A [Opitutia bacterium UBA7350]|nr:MAG: Oligopeptidase A [Opitutae bacterium UBA7350]
MQHPFLAQDFKIAWSSLTPSAVEPDIKRALKNAQTALDALAMPLEKIDTLSYENSFAALERATEQLQHAWGLVNHLDSVCNSPELRAAHHAMLPAVTQFFADIPLNEGIWKRLRAAAKAIDLEQLHPHQKRHVSETLADFRDQGADLPDAQKIEVREIQQELAQLTQKYAENCLDATHAWEIFISDESKLAGLPESALETARQSAIDKGQPEAWRFTLQAPSLIAVLSYADNASLRKTLWKAYSAIGRKAPNDNQTLVPKILKLRHRLACVLGKQHFADYVTARRIVKNAATAINFIENMHARIVDRFQEEICSLQDFKATSTGKTSEPLEPWESAYWAEKQRRAGYDFDEEFLRPYFPIDRVISGLFDLTGEIFGLQIIEGKAETWHPDVRYYELWDAARNEMLGGFYADWHPRESKRGGAWMNYLITGEREPGKTRSPHLGLICGNLSPALKGKPACLTHHEVETIFHEFGHLLHHLCGEVAVKSLNGVNVAWDFVELPSQIMENWCWERLSLNRFARHRDTGEIIPETIFNKMQAARNFRKASSAMRQLALGRLDLALHTEWPDSPEDPDTFVKAHIATYQPTYKTEPQPNTYNFGHLFSDSTGYAAGYYSYKWAEVLDADAFTRFQAEGLLNPITGRDFRDKILARGDAEEPAQLFRDFMGRDPEPDALLRRDGLL